MTWAGAVFARTWLARPRCTRRTRARRQNPRLRRPSTVVARDSDADCSPPGTGGADRFAYRFIAFRDPEGNRIEPFVDTPWYVQQPLRIPMDMKLPDAELWAWAEARKLPGFRPVEQWRDEISRAMQKS